MPPTSTGAASTMRNEVASMDHTNMGSRPQVMPGAREQITVTIRLNPARMMDRPISPKATAKASLPGVSWTLPGA